MYYKHIKSKNQDKIHKSANFYYHTIIYTKTKTFVKSFFEKYKIYFTIYVNDSNVQILHIDFHLN